MKTSLGFLFLVMVCVSGFATDLTFTFANGQITGTTQTSYEFDVMIQANETGTRLGDTQVYVSYDVLGFGSNIVANSKITVSKGQLLQGDLIPGLALYTIVNVVDNSSSKISIASGYNYDTAPGSANLVPAEPTQLLHVSIQIADSLQNAGLTFDPVLMADNQYKSDNSTKYSPVVADDSDDSPLKRIPSYIEIAQKNILPSSFELKQNFPNPFNPETKIGFDIPITNGSMIVELSIYNTTGQKIKTLYSGALPPGTYALPWDGTDNNMNLVASGTYFYQLKSDKFSDIKKMVLVR